MIFAVDPALDPLLSYGPLGVIFVACFVAFIGGMIYSKKQVDGMRVDWAETLKLIREDSASREALLREDLKRVEKQREAAMDVIQDKMLPLLGSFTATTQALLPLLQAAIPVLERSDERERGTGIRGGPRGGRSTRRDPDDG